MDVKLVFGPMLLGVCANLILYGILLIQLSIYFQSYPKDGWPLKLFALYLLVAETLNSGFDIAMIYQPLVELHGDPRATQYFPLDPFITVAISTPIQLFIAYRLRLLSKSWVIPIVIAALALLSLSGGIYTGTMVLILKRFALKPKLHTPALIWLVSSAVADVLITTGLTYNLWKQKTGFRSTDHTISKIIRLTIQTGFITAVVACLDVISFMALPKTTINFIWDFSLSKLYSNVLLSTLNARASWRRGANETETHNVLFGHQRGTSPPQSNNLTLTSPDFVIAKSETAQHTRGSVEFDVELALSSQPTSSVATGFWTMTDFDLLCLTE
ncbi:hypothetical protein DL96DRAFT_1050186 [Flagelloscypha sp. PMI_526]|nr:hypothetical protein DL96DRAFT_1050186 [Flagelloscypha sp. PMI_526]